MKISNLNAEIVLEEEGLSEYKAGMEFFYSELVELNTILYLAEQVIDFPFELFAHPDKTIFFDVVMRSFHDSAILLITRLATDQKGDLYTLTCFKNRVRELVKPEFKDSFDERLREVRFDREVNLLLEKAEELRRNRIAHTTKNLMSGSIEVSRPTVSELKVLRDALNSLIDAISFNAGHVMLPIPYAPDVLYSSGNDESTDIEDLLDCIARNSHLLNMPERYPRDGSTGGRD
jgi:hypothetical protein